MLPWLKPVVKVLERAREKGKFYREVLNVNTSMFSVQARTYIFGRGDVMKEQSRKCKLVDGT
jgi:hypothetical protein